MLFCVILFFMANMYDNADFFSAYSDMTRSKEGLRGAGEWECVKALLPPLSDISILDLGCGFGWHAKYFVGQGASSVLAVDMSEKMLCRAREINSDEKIEYRCGDMEDFEMESDSYDMVFSSLAIHYVKDYQRLVRKVYASLKKGGVFLFSVEHPVFTAEGSEDWCYDDSGEIRHFPVDRYFEEGGRETNFIGFKVMKYHRTLTSYVSALLNEGFTITAIKEPEVPNHLKNLEEMRNESRRPMMLVLEAVKI